MLRVKHFRPILFALCMVAGYAAHGAGRNEDAPDDSADFQVGKAVFYEKVFCPDCPYPLLAIPAGIPEIAPELTREGSLGRQLTLKERRSLALFLRRQFDVEMELR